MISKLTPEQESKVPEYLWYWLNVGLRIETINRKRAKESIDFLYTKILKMDKPKQYLFLESPMACQIFLNASNQLKIQLWNQLENQLGNQLRKQLWNQKMQFIYESKTNWTQYYYWFYSFIINEIFPEKKKDFSLFLEYLEHSKHYHHIYLSPDVAIFSDFPKTISINSEGNLDNAQGKALEYRDGYGFYALNGITAGSSLELELL